MPPIQRSKLDAKVYSFGINQLAMNLDVATYGQEHPTPTRKRPNDDRPKLFDNPMISDPIEEKIPEIPII